MLWLADGDASFNCVAWFSQCLCGMDNRDWPAGRMALTPVPIGSIRNGWENKVSWGFKSLLTLEYIAYMTYTDTLPIWANVSHLHITLSSRLNHLEN